MKKMLYLILAGVFFLLGLVGLVLPVIPQIPFFVLSALFASAGSERIRQRVTRTKLYQKYLADTVEKNEILSRFLQA